MVYTPKKVINTYISITLLSTLAASFIWGINTLFLLDAGLTNTQAFTANAFFTVGQVLFEVPTGVVADTWGRKTSYMLGAATLLVSTLLYLAMWQYSAPFIGWALASLLIGLGFTFFSGAVEAWLVDALNFTKFNGSLENVFAKGQITAGIAMLSGSVLGGVIAQATNIGVPYILRAVFLFIAFAFALVLMKDLGFKPKKSKKPTQEMKAIFKTSIDKGLRRPQIRWVMLTSPFMFGAGAYAFYAAQPYLLELYGDPTAYSVAGIAAASIAGAQIAGGLLVPLVRKGFKKRTTVLIGAVILSVLALLLIGIASNFYVVIALLILWAMTFALSGPVRQAYLNKLIDSEQRATVLSFDALLGSAGAAITQPILGRAADAWSYSTTYAITGFIQLGALPFLLLAKRAKSPADDMKS